MSRYIVCGKTLIVVSLLENSDYFHYFFYFYNNIIIIIMQRLVEIYILSNSYRIFAYLFQFFPLKNKEF